MIGFKDNESTLLNVLPLAIALFGSFQSHKIINCVLFKEEHSNTRHIWQYLQ